MLSWDKLARMQDAFAYSEALVRAADRDRFLTGLFAPAAARAALYALYAFNVEIARVREVARDPLAGEIRLQWWGDVLDGEARGDVEANPVAAALLATVARHGLPVDRLKSLIAARRFDLYNEPMATLAELEAYADDASAGLMALAAGVLDARRSPDIDRLMHHAGAAHAITGLLYALPTHAARGQLYVPVELLQHRGGGQAEIAAGVATAAVRAALTDLRQVARDHLAAARRLLGAASPALLPALLPLAPVPAMLTNMERRGYDPFAPLAIASWRRQWLIWRASRQPARLFA